MAAARDIQAGAEEFAHVRRLGEAAVVIGAGMGGLSAAAALSGYFENVCVLDRDTLPSSSVPRTGVPQGRHPHGILAGGLQALEALLPGYGNALADAGAVPITMFRDVCFERPDVGPMPQRDCGISVLSASRPLIEAILRRQVSEVANVRIRAGCRATEITYRERKPLVHYVNGPGDEAAMQADIVVDASGRGGLTLSLLDRLGWAQPPETMVGVDISYSTAMIPWVADRSRRWQMAVTNPEPPELAAAAFLLPAEDGRCYVTLAQHHASERPQTWPELLVALRGLKTTTIYDAVCEATPIGEVSHFIFHESCWRHFEQLTELPPRVLPIGDAVCRFNPVYGQGMSVAAQQARLLHDVLGRARLADDPVAAAQRDFMSAVGALLEVAWTMGVNADFAYPKTRGTRPDDYEDGKRFEADLFRAAVFDPVVQRALAEVLQLLQPIDVLYSAAMKRRIESVAGR